MSFRDTIFFGLLLDARNRAAQSRRQETDRPAGQVRRSMSMNDVRNVLETRCPGLHGRIEQMLIDAEARYRRRTSRPASGFFLEATQRTTAIALKISSIEGVDSFLPVLVALYHDAGKFHDGGYHKDD